MTDKIKLQVVEVEANKLIPGAKYIFRIDPRWANHWEQVAGDLGNLLGRDNFTILWLPESSLNIYAIAEETK